MNMTLAVISDSFYREKDKEEEKEENKKRSKEKRKEDLKRQLKRVDSTTRDRMQAEFEQQENDRETEKPVQCVQKSCLCCGTTESHHEYQAGCLKGFNNFVRHPAFDLFITIAIGVNFLVLCLDYYRAPFVLTQVLQHFNFWLTIIFVLELIFKKLLSLNRCRLF